MYTEEKLRRVNKVIKDMVFTYEGRIIAGLEWKTKFDYRSPRFVFNAAGFIAMSASGASPGVRISELANES